MYNWLLGAMIFWNFIMSSAVAVCIGVLIAERRTEPRRPEAAKKPATPRQMTYDDALRAAQMVNLWHYDGSEQTPASELAQKMMVGANRKGGGKR